MTDNTKKITDMENKIENLQDSIFCLENEVDSLELKISDLEDEKSRFREIILNHHRDMMIGYKSFDPEIALKDIVEALKSWS